MHPQVFISVFVLLLPGAVDAYVAVQGVAGQPVTLPCSYSVSRGVRNTCWGQGECPLFNCANTLIWTNGYRVTYQRSIRHHLQGPISAGNVSLTIENALQSDSGLYCCRTQFPGWFNDQKVTFSLEVKPAIPTSPPTRPQTTGNPTTTSTGSTHVPTSTRVTTSSSPATTALMQTEAEAETEPHKPEPTTFYTHETTAEVTETPPYTPTDWNNTVTSSDDSENYTETMPTQMQQMNTNNGFYIGISVTALLLVLLLVSTLAMTNYIHMKKKSASLSLVAFHVSKTGALQNKVVVEPQAEDEVCIIEDSPYSAE